MTQKAINFKLVIPTVSAIAFGTIVLIGVVYLKDRYPLPIDRAEASQSVAGNRRSAELPGSDGRLWRIHVLLR